MNDTIFPIKRGIDANVRLSMLLWGGVGSGKTTWAATAPGDKLWLSFGDSEHVSVSGRGDVYVMDLSSVSPDEVFKHGIGASPFGLDKQLYERKNIKTVVCDSLTAIQYLGLQKAVSDGIGAGKGFTPTMQAPGRSAFGGRNQNLLGVMKSLLSVTGKHKVNIIFTAHENDPVTRLDARGVESIEYIGMSLGGQLVNNVSAQISEIWNLRQEPGGKRNRIVTTRVSGMRKPMKTRMFSQKGESSFILNYDPDKHNGDPGQTTIASFWEQWQKNGMRRILVPSTRKGGDETDNVVVRLGTGGGA
jgi:AAA domain